MTTTKRKYPPLALDDEMPFGQHKGEPIWRLVEDEPEYVEWLLENTEVQFDDEAFEAIQKGG